MTYYSSSNFVLQAKSQNFLKNVGQLQFARPDIYGMVPRAGCFRETRFGVEPKRPVWNDVNLAAFQSGQGDAKYMRTGVLPLHYLVYFYFFG